ncbi:MAG: ribonuclease HII [Actinomycetia bacterium]|nr:ribonuclease HII [Actinomycetes bacterium]
MATTVPKLRPSLRSSSPGTGYERDLWLQGAEFIVGIDEVGKGAWAGPLTVGAVVIPRDRRIYKVRDSKQLTPAEREGMADRIKDWAVSWAVGHASAAECDDLGMSDAQRLATRRALADLSVDPSHALLDGNWDFVDTIDTTTIVKGDTKSLSIAAASIIAKVTRDALMAAESEMFPWYSFDANKGYPCHRHRAALRILGPTTIHRRTWVYMRDLGWDGIIECREQSEPLSLF